MKRRDNEMENHVCVVLKTTVKEIYKWETNENDILSNNVKILLNHVLCSNQYISNTLTEIMKKELGPKKFYKEWGAIFPGFLDNYDEQIILDNMDRINDEIDSIEPIETLKNLNKEEYYKYLFSLDKFTLLDLTIPWSKIVSYFKYQPEQFKKELQYSEYGYYIGELINVSIQNFRKKYSDDEWINPDWLTLRSRVDRYLIDIEKNMKK